MADDRNIRRFLETALASALDLGLVHEDELIAIIGTERLIEHISVEARARLLGAFLDAEEVGCELLVRTIGIATLSANAPATLLWRVVSLAGRRAAGDDVEGPALDVALDVDVRGSAPSVAKPSRGKSAAKAVESDDDLADERRKPNRRVSGAGATSRRRTRDPSPPPQTAHEAPTTAMFVASRRSASLSHRAATEPAIPGDDIAEIEVIDETDIAFTPPANGKPGR